MTREEAAQVLTKLADDFEKHELSENGWLKTTYIPAHRMGAAALRGPQPDPETGLVPCGCGGKAETHELYGEYSGTYMTDCKECGTGTTQYSTKKESRDAWNTAMGRASE